MTTQSHLMIYWAKSHENWLLRKIPEVLEEMRRLGMSEQDIKLVMAADPSIYERVACEINAESHPHNNLAPATAAVTALEVLRRLQSGGPSSIQFQGL
jgi:hypothetical protein